MSDRKETEDRLRAQAELLELTHDAIIVRDLGGRIQLWNRGAQAIFGYTPRGGARTGRRTAIADTISPAPKGVGGRAANRGPMGRDPREAGEERPGRDRLHSLGAQDRSPGCARGDPREYVRRNAPNGRRADEE
ncbi:MAG: PAS domain S-box protein [Deltaproteobacteria bacterium]|nr:PAS domain S-box protein [Deltaproteobacteria bacterium]